jgi:hypothetical protein
MLNDIDFDYIDLGLPNLVWAKSKATPPSKPVRLANKLAPLAFEAAKKFPRWTFVGVITWVHEAWLEVDKLKVYENREEIGVLHLTTRTRSGTKYTLSNERIAEGRKRGNSTETKDAKKALRLMAKTFGAKTVSEKLAEIDAKLYSSMVGGHANISHVYNIGWHDITKYLPDYVFNNFEQVSAAAINAGAKAEDVKKLPELREGLDIAKKLYNAYTANDGWTVFINVGTYVVQGRGCDNTELYTSDTLPGLFKRGVGMLKLVENATFLRDVGFRLDENVFFILKEEANE